ncbi:MAG TPA: hypothetical protein VJI98_02825 [Candidatus Nanoarchaeia archaeon]|nr:hypothetical protein [Candidatus Nanoarchaeia archaeon]
MISKLELFVSTTIIMGMVSWSVFQASKNSQIGIFIEQPRQCAEFGVCLTKWGNSGYLLRTTQLKMYGESLEDADKRATAWGRHLTEHLSLRGMNQIDSDGDYIITDDEREVFYGIGN